jgi:hypothetical protein
MRPKNGVYEYNAIYVDDLAIAMADPQEFVDVLEKKHKFKLKGEQLLFTLVATSFVMTKASCVHGSKEIHQEDDDRI